MQFEQPQPREAKTANATSKVAVEQKASDKPLPEKEKVAPDRVAPARVPKQEPKNPFNDRPARQIMQIDSEQGIVVVLNGEIQDEVQTPAQARLNGNAAPPPKNPLEIQLYSIYRAERDFFERRHSLDEGQKSSLQETQNSWKEHAAAAVLSRVGLNPALNIAQGILGNGAPAARGNVVLTPGSTDFQTAANNYRKTLRKTLSNILQESKREDYEKECQARDSFQARADAEMLVTVLELHISLSSETRQALVISVEKWPSLHDHRLTYYLSNRQYFPPIPDSYIAEHLNESQMSVFRSLTKLSVRQQQFAAQNDPFQ